MIMDNFFSAFRCSNADKSQSAKSIKTMLYYTARWILGLVFIYASFDKIRHPEAFAVMVNNYQLLPGELVNLTALVLPWLELILGICLITGWMMPGTVAISSLLLIIFMVILLYNMQRGLDISCGCFSTDPEQSPVTTLTLARDGFFLVLSLYLSWVTFPTMRK